MSVHIMKKAPAHNKCKGFGFKLLNLVELSCRCCRRGYWCSNFIFDKITHIEIKPAHLHASWPTDFAMHVLPMPGGPAITTNCLISMKRQVAISRISLEGIALSLKLKSNPSKVFSWPNFASLSLFLSMLLSLWHNSSWTNREKNSP